MTPPGPKHPDPNFTAELNVGDMEADIPTAVHTHPQQQEQAQLQYLSTVRAAMRAGHRMPQFAGRYGQGIPQIDAGYGYLPLYPANQALYDMTARFRPAGEELPATLHSDVHFHGHPASRASMPPPLLPPPGSQPTAVSANAISSDNRPVASIGGLAPDDSTPHVEAPAASQTKVAPHTFIAEFSDHFRDDPAVLQSFHTLCHSYNRNAISAAVFFIGIYRMVFKAQSRKLLAHYISFLPRHWKSVDFAWLDREIEQEMLGTQAGPVGAEVCGQQVEKDVRMRPQKRKKVPVNGFRAGDGNQAAGDETMLVSGSGSDFEHVDDTDGSDYTPQRPAKLVKLPTGNSSTKIGLPKATPTKSRAPTLPAASPQSSYPANTTISPYIFKTKHKGYSRLPASEVAHVGPVYPTRHSIFHRKDNPYICGICGEGYAHPSDVAGHHGQNRNTGGGTCWVRHGKPGGEGGKWDSHESCKVGYRDIDYSRVMEGFVVLDQGSADRIEGACDVGRRFKRGKEEGVDEAVGFGREVGDERIVELGEGGEGQ